MLAGGFEAAEAFFTGYLLEKALSVDNIFVMAMLFRQFRVEPAYQHRVLFWGIIGAIISRSIMIFVGVWLVTRFSWLFYVFGAYLAFAGVKMVFTDEDDDEDEQFDPDKSLIMRIVGRVIPIARDPHGARLTARENGKLHITKLGLALVVIELTDVIFALDSVPAVLAITTDSFIVLTSNIFAILGLRAMYFVLATMLDKFRYLQIALAIVLVVIGTKMFLHNVYDIPTSWSLIGIGSILALGITASLMANRAPKLDVELEESKADDAAPAANEDVAAPSADGEADVPSETRGKGE